MAFATGIQKLEFHIGFVFTHEDPWYSFLNEKLHIYTNLHQLRLSFRLSCPEFKEDLWKVYKEVEDVEK